MIYYCCCIVQFKGNEMEMQGVAAIVATVRACDILFSIAIW